MYPENVLNYLLLPPQLRYPEENLPLIFYKLTYGVSDTSLDLREASVPGSETDQEGPAQYSRSVVPKQRLLLKDEGG